MQKSILTMIEHSLLSSRILWVLSARAVSKIIPPLKSRCIPVRCMQHSPVDNHHLVNRVKQLVDLPHSTQVRHEVISLMKHGFVAHELVHAMIESQSLDKPQTPAMVGLAASLSSTLKDDDWMNVMLVHSLAHKRISHFIDPAHSASRPALASVAFAPASPSHP